MTAVASAARQYTGPQLGRVRNIDAAMTAYGDRVNDYAEAMLVGDPLADAFAADCAALGRGRLMRIYGQWLTGEVDLADLPGAPESLKALIDQLSAVPTWVDFDQIDLGAAAYTRHAREAGIALGTSSLVSGYHNAAAARPLFVTGRFGSQLARTRAYETSRWTFAAARPGGMHRFGPGFERTARVRMIHAFVRQHILTMPGWDVHEYGVPINQADLAFTAIEFSLMPIRAMQQLGVHFTAAEIDSMYALWRYMGYLIGLDERVLVVNAEDTALVEALQHATSPPPDDNCREFVRTLLDDVLATDLTRATGVLGLVGRYRGRALLHGLARDFVGDQIADDLAIDDTVWKHVPAITTPVLNVMSRVSARFPALQERQMRRSLAEVDAVLDATALDLGITHDLVDHAAAEHPARG